MNVSSIDLVNSISESLECKIDYDPLTKAVSLWPCLHTMDKNAAAARHGTIVDQKCSEANIICIMCREPVVSYGKNPLIRKLTKEVATLKTTLEEYTQKKLQVSDPLIQLVDSVSGLLKCKESNSPFTKAVSLWPCLCTMDEDSAVKRHGTLVDQKCSEIGVACLYCQTPVVSYGRNHLICDLAEEIARLKTLIHEEQKQKKEGVKNFVDLDMGVLESEISEIKDSNLAIASPENAYRRKKSQLPDENLYDYQIVHHVNYEREGHFNFMSCVSECFGWTLNRGIE
jgi:hypothetical protein